MEILQLRYFCDAAEGESFSATAHKYGVPPSNISQTVSRLERELGVKLFERSSNKVMLNEYGRNFYNNVKGAISSLDTAVSELKDLTGTWQSEIRLKVCTNRRAVTETIEKFQKIHPDVNFMISHNYGDEGDFDFIISDIAPRGENYLRELLITEKFMLAAREDSPAVNVKSVHLLSNERFITMQNQSSLWRCTEQICRANGFEPNIAITSDDPLYVRRYIELGLGIAFVPAFSWRGQFSDEVRLVDICNYTRDTYVFFRSDRYMSEAAKSFKNMLADIS